VVGLGILGGRPLSQHLQVGFNLLLLYPLPGIRVPAFRLLGLLLGEDAVSELELLAGGLMRTDRQNPGGQPKPRHALRRRPAERAGPMVATILVLFDGNFTRRGLPDGGCYNSLTLKETGRSRSLWTKVGFSTCK